MSNNVSNKRVKLLSEMKLSKELDCDTFFNVNYVNSFNAFLNAIMGGRGIGKSTQFMIWLIKQVINKGRRFVYVVRYKNQTKIKKNVILEFNDEIKIIGDGYGGFTWKWYGHIIGYIIPLSVQQSYRSNNYMFEDVHYMLFDEGILKVSNTTRYLDDEVTQLLELASTVFRLKEDCHIYVLGNNLDFFNPYSEYFNVKLFNKVYYDKERSLFIMYADDSPKLRKLEEKSSLFKLTQGTAYHEYHYNNVVLSDKIAPITPLRKTDKKIISIIINTYQMNFYIRDNKKYCIASSRKLRPEESITLLTNNEINYYGFDFVKQRFLRMFKYWYANDELEFCDTDAEPLFQALIAVY